MEVSLKLSQIQTSDASSRLMGNDATVCHITHDSREVKPGSLFVCLIGSTHDGHHHIAQALESGATGLVVHEGHAPHDLQLPDHVGCIVVADTRTALPLFACTLYGNPSHKLLMVGVTGTNGKTTSMRMVAEILRYAGYRVGTIGTLGSEVDGSPIESEHTTPEADQLQCILHQMVELGAHAVVMEVSSHALAQHRTAGIAFNGAIFTNITQDHLDFHKTPEAYFEAKATLFSQYPVRYPRPDGSLFVASINVSQWEGRDLVTLARGDVITFSASTNTPAVVKASSLLLHAEQTSFTMHYDSGVEQFELPIVLPVGGAFQVSNALGAAAITLRLGINREHIQKGLQNLPPVPGRFQSVDTGGRGFSVIVDYAHTPDGLENLLNSARALNPARLICVFGCGGNRDRTKRPIMGKLAASLAEIAIVTSDNPRNEDPEFIVGEVLEGMQNASAEVFSMVDRHDAIFLAISMAKPGDIVLIAGKGHEDYQIVGDEVRHFDDREVAAEALSQLTGSSL